MSGQDRDDQPRQPKDMPGLLKFCLEATRGEDAIPRDPDAVLSDMGEERRQWLQEALANMSCDVVEQLAEGIKILNSNTADLDDKEIALDCLEDWVGQIDMANNFHKIGGYTAIKSCMESSHPSLRAGAAHLSAELGQNNPYCQERFIQEGFIDMFVRQLDNDDDDTAKVKALYAVSCICRENPDALKEFAKLDGWSVVLRAIQSNCSKLRTKACFFLSAVAPGNQEIQQELLSMGLIEQLSAMLQQPHDKTHEHVLGSLVALVRENDKARVEAGSKQLRQLLKNREEQLKGKEEYEEELEYCRELSKLCFSNDHNIGANR